MDKQTGEIPFHLIVPVVPAAAGYVGRITTPRAAGGFASGRPLTYGGGRRPKLVGSFGLEPADISNVLLFLASELSRYVTAAAIPIYGMAIKAADRAQVGQALAEETV